MIDIKTEVKKLEDDIIRWRRDLHQIPEVDDDLPKTTAYVRGELEKAGIEYRTFSNTGIQAVVRGTGTGPVIGFRADMDALPVREQTGLPFASDSGNMHACGHDAHTAMLLGAAKFLSAHRDELAGTVVFLFQPAEETTGGSKIMIEEGCLAEPKVDRFISLHIGTLFDDVQNGQIGVKKGPLMAAVDSYYVKVKGVGGHGARPHECVDPVVIMAEMIQSLQKIVSREINPVHGAVITVGMVKAGTIVNVIPEEAEFCGTIRTLDPKDRAYIEKRVKTLITHIAEANGASAEVDYRKYYPATINDGDVTEFLARCAAEIVGEENVVEISEPSTGTEDVAYYIREVPGSFGILGSRKAHSDGICYPHHNSRFHLDESVMWLGTAVFVKCALEYCGKQ